MRKWLLFCCLCCTLSSFGKTYNVKDFGAKGDGVAIDSKAINDAITEAAKNGGGTVFIPAGDYLCYSIQMASHINLHLEQNAQLIAANGSGFDEAEPNAFDMYQDYGHSHWKNALIWGIGLEDITISGDGIIYGENLRRLELPKKGEADKAISLKLCKNVTLRDFSMKLCGHFALLATGVDNLSIYNVKVDSNRDGFDIDCCKNVRISNCSVNTPWDDAIVLKASYALGYFRDTEDVTISDCLVSGYDKGTMIDATWQRNDPQAPDKGFVTGRIKLGTESSGGFKNIAISNCVFDRCRGLAIECVDGGHLEDLVVTNITMRDIVNAPIYLRLGGRMRSPEGTPIGTMKRVLISNVNVFNADSRHSNIIAGIPGGIIEDVHLSNIHIWHKGGYTEADGLIEPKEDIKGYPDPMYFGTNPAKGFFIRHAKNITLTDIHFHYLEPDGRPLFKEDDAKNVTYRHITVDGKPYTPN